MKTLAKTTKSFAKICLLTLGVSSTVRVESAEVDTSGEGELDISSTCCPAAILIGNVVLHSSIAIDLELNGLNRTSKTRIILPSIVVVSITLGIINMLFWSIDAKSLVCDLELFCSIAKREEA
jgi:hypothetical protein